VKFREAAYERSRISRLSKQTSLLAFGLERRSHVSSVDETDEAVLDIFLFIKIEVLW